MVLFIFNITKTTINESPRKIILSEYLHKPDDHIRQIYHHDRWKYLEISDHCTYQVHRLLLFQNIFEYSYRYQNILDLERYDDLHEPLPYQTLGPWYKALQEAREQEQILRAHLALNPEFLRCMKSIFPDASRMIAYTAL